MKRQKPQMKRRKAVTRLERARGVQRPKTVADYFAMPAEAQDTYNRALHVANKMRADRRLSLRRASAEYGLDSETVLRYARSAFSKRKGRYVAKPHDHLLRVLTVVTTDGPREAATKSSRVASEYAEHAAAVQKYLQTGDGSRLRRFRRKRLRDVDGNKIALLTEPEELDRQGSAGNLSFESLYARSA